MTVEMDDESWEAIHDEIEAKSHEDRHMTDKAEIVEYFRDKYGETKWIPHFTDKMIDALGLENTKKNRNTVSRDVQGKRVDVSPRKGETKRKYVDLGKTLPTHKVPKDLRGKRARVRCQVTIRFSNGKTVVTKDIKRTLSVEQTQDLLETGGIDAILEAYGINPDDAESAEDVHIEIDFID